MRDTWPRELSGKATAWRSEAGGRGSASGGRGPAASYPTSAGREKQGSKDHTASPLDNTTRRKQTILTKKPL